MKRSSAFRTISGGVCAPQGFFASGVAAGIKKNSRKDIALVVSRFPCFAAGSFTTNMVKGAPVLFDLQQIRTQPVWGIVVNSDNANACTGRLGLRNAYAMSKIASREVSAHGFLCNKNSFLVCSTGRIGIQLPMAKIAHGIHQAAAQLSRNSRTAAEAIMTTDTFAKQIAVEMQIGGKKVRLSGMAKGAGMIQPVTSPSGKPSPLHATMLSFLTTDAVISRNLLQACLNRAISQSFNRISVDGDMSTNDTVLLLANGCAAHSPLRWNSNDLRCFQSSLDYVTFSLAQMIVQDGEGTSKIVTLEVTGAATATEAELAVRAIGNSKLVKCSWYGENPNWGRLCDAIGYSGARLNPSTLFIAYNGIRLVHKGLQITKNLPIVRRLMKKPAFSIECGLGLGKYRAILYTTDLTEKYVKLNKDE